MSLTPTERSMRARLAAHTLHARGGTNTAPARAKFEERFLDEVDPHRVLPESIRFARAGHARKAYFTRLALKAASSRRAKRERGSTA